MSNNGFWQTGFFADKIEMDPKSKIPKVRQKVFFNGHQFKGKNDPNEGKIVKEAIVEYIGQDAIRLFNYAQKHTKKLQDGSEVNTKGKGMPIFHVGVLETVSFKDKNDGDKKVKYDLLHGKYWNPFEVLVVKHSVTFTGELSPEYKTKDDGQKELYFDAKVYLNQKIYQDDKKNRSVGPVNVRIRGRAAEFLKGAAERHTKKENGVDVKTNGKGLVLDAIGILMQDNWENDNGQNVFALRMEVVELNYPSFIFSSSTKNTEKNAQSNTSSNQSSSTSSSKPKVEEESKIQPELDIDIDADLDTNISLDDDPFGIDNDDLDLEFEDDDPLKLEDDVKTSLV